MRTWTEKDKKRQACIARRDRPWRSSTGPRTPAGKAAASKNAFRHGFRSADIAHLIKVLKMQRRFIKGYKRLVWQEIQLHNAKYPPGYPPPPSFFTNELLSALVRSVDESG